MPEERDRWKGQPKLGEGVQTEHRGGLEPRRGAGSVQLC